MTNRLAYLVFDADNHMYEQPDAFTRYLPNDYKHVVQLMEINGRQKLVINNTISEYIPNPTFNVVARPGAQEDFFKNGNPEGRVASRSSANPFVRPKPSLGPSHVSASWTSRVSTERSCGPRLPAC